MIKFITGRSCTGKSTELFSLLTGAVDTGKRTILLVPDQFTFETERKLAVKTHEKHNEISVYGFDSLAGDIIRQHGGKSEYADDTCKIIAMKKALNEIKDGLSFYNAHVNKQTFVSSCISQISKFKQAGLKSGELIKLAEKCENELLKKKLTDLALIEETYNAEITKRFEDRLDNLNVAQRLAMESAFFEGCDVYVDGFNSFTGAQLNLLKLMIERADNFTIALRTDKSGNYYFKQTDKTLLRLEGFARELEKEISYTHLTTSYASPVMQNVDSLILDNKTCTDKKEGQVVILSSPDREREGDYICSLINRMVMSEGYRYRDIAVISPNLSSYVNVLSSSMETYDTPAFIDKSVPVIKKPLTGYILNMLRLSQDMTGRNVISLLKTGFVRIKSKDDGEFHEVGKYEIDMLETFGEQWDLMDKSWAKPFPRKKTGEKDFDAYDSCEYIRQQITDPITAFNKRVSKAGTTAAVITEELIKLLFDDFDISKAIQGRCRDVNSDTFRYDKTLTDEYNNLWGIIADMLDSVFYFADDMKLNVEEYTELISTCARNITISATPNVIDRVIVGDISRTVLADKKAVFVIGADNAAFSDISADKGMFSGREIAELSGLAPDLADTDTDIYNARQLEIYNTLTLAQNSLIISWKGTEDDIAPVVKRIAKELSLEIKDIDLVSPKEFCTTTGALKKQYAKCCLKDELTAEELRAALIESGNGDFALKVDNAKKRKLSGANHHDIGSQGKIIFGGNYLSPTGTETLCGCLFKYFIKYGLRIKENTSIRMNGTNYGTITHYILNYCFKEIFAPEKIDSLSEDELKQYLEGCKDKAYLEGLTTRAADEYRENELIPVDSTSPVYNEMYENIRNNCVEMLPYMIDEIKESRFIPRYFELSLDNSETADGKITASPFRLKVTVGDGKELDINIGGTADRIDIATVTDENNNTVLETRAIDYKTYAKATDLTKVFYGLDLQMLLYLFALCEANPKKLRESETLYYNITGVPTVNSHLTDAYLNGIWANNHTHNDIVVDNTTAKKEIDAMQGKYNYPDNNGKVKTVSNKPTVLTDELLSKLKEHICKVIADNLLSAYKGKISAVPVVKDDDLLSCEYCRYKNVCGFSKDEVKDIKGDEAIAFKNIYSPEPEKEDKTKEKNPEATKEEGE